jgi:hypothetical protein
MKKVILVLFAIIAISATTNVQAQVSGDGLVDVYVTGPECCPDDGNIFGYRSDGNAGIIDYAGQSGTTGAPGYYVLAYTGNFINPLPTTAEVITDWGYAYWNSHWATIRCEGSDTKSLGYGNPLVLNVNLNVLEQGVSNEDPPNED